MSQTEMYVIQANGDIDSLCEFWNSHRGAMLYWREIAVRYGVVTRENQFMLGMGDDGLETLWKLYQDESVDPDWRIVLMTTFDNVMVRREDMSRVARAFEKFAQSVTTPPGFKMADTPGDPGHAIEQARVLRVLDIAAPDIRGVCWNQTSVCSNPWWICGEDEEDEGRAYNVEKDTDPGWWLDLADCGVTSGGM